MKHVILIISTFAACIAMMHAATNDYIWSQKPATGALVSRNLTPTAGRLVGFPTSVNSPETIILGTGLTLTGNTLSVTSSGGSFETLTGVPEDNAALVASLGLRLAAALNLSDLADMATARTNLGLGSVAELNAIGTAQITDGTIVNADISASAAIALSKLATDPLARANHTGTQLMSTISNAGTLALQNSAAVSITGGFITGAGNVLIIDLDTGDISGSAAIEASTFSGNGAALTALNASNISSGSLNIARLADGSITNAKLATDPTNATNISSGTLSNLRTAALSGDITKSAGSGVTTLANTTVTAGSYTAANITVDSKGRITAAASEDGSGLTALNASNLASGEVPAARMPALTGDVTTTAGSVATTIATGAVGPTQLASTAVTAGSYTNANVTVDADGRVTAASNGSGSGATLGANTFIAQQINSTNGAASTSPMLLSGAIFTGGTGTTTAAALTIKPTAATAATTLSTAGTVLHINTPSGFSGNMIDARLDGSDSFKFRVDHLGNIYIRDGHAFVSNGTASFMLKVGGVDTIVASASGVQLVPGLAFGVIPGVSSTHINAESAGVVQLGLDHGTTATAQKIKAHDVTTGTGASMTIAGGNGSAAGGAVIISTSPTTTPTERVRVSATGEVFLNLPTSAGTTGSLWNDGGTVKVAP